MTALYYIIIFLFVIICLSLVGIILMQSSKTGGMGAGMAGNTALSAAFGGQGADKLLVKITTILAVLFMVLSITLNILSTSDDDGFSISNKSVMQGSEEQSNISIDANEESLVNPADTTSN